MNAREDSPFYEIGYTTPEQGEEFRAAHLEKQKVSNTSAKQRKVGRRAVRRVRDYESDRDYVDMLAALPEDFVDEPDEGEPIENPRLVAHVIARRAKTRQKAEELGADSIEFRIWLEKYNRDHPLPT